MKLSEPKVTLTTFLDPRYKKKGTKKYPVKMRVNFKGERLYLNLNEDLSEEEFDNILTKKVRGRLKDIQVKIEKQKSKANSVIDTMQTFNFTEFKKLMGD